MKFTSIDLDLNLFYSDLKSEKKFKPLQLHFFNQKGLLTSIGLNKYYSNINFSEKLFKDNISNLIDLEDSINSSHLNKFKLGPYRYAWFSFIHFEQKKVGLLVLPSNNKPSSSSKNTIISLKLLIEQQLQLSHLSQEINKTKKELSNKTLETESLIDVTEIINSQKQAKGQLFSDILIMILSIMNASKGLVLIRDKKSDFFNVEALFNLNKEEEPKHILRITKGILKNLNDSMSSLVINDPENYKLLNFTKKNCIVSPLESNNQLEGAIILIDKESRHGTIRFTNQDLRLFDSLCKKVSLAYDNIQLIDSLKESHKLVENIMSSITTGIIMINVLGEIEFVNNSAKKIFSIDNDDFLQNHYFMVFQNNQNLISLIEEAESQNDVIFENNFKIDDLRGTSHEINLTLSPAFNEENERSGIVFSFEDLSNLNKLKSTFKKYVSENIVDELLKNETSLELGGAQNEVCILFCDIRGFTAMSEKMKPEEVVYLLNNYFESMIDVVFSNNGTLDKIIGDELMVLYGVPLKQHNDAQRAVDSAKQMFQALAKFNDKIAIEGLPKLEIGIGINQGKVVCGNIGSQRQMNYTVIGDAVNLAARLCSHAKAGQIVISKSVFTELENNQGFDEKDPIFVKGKKEQIQNWIFNA